ncbi:MAG TPA: ABC transporter permease [bacterium]|nr:ABC transporter permease [bacterium]
MIALIVKDFKRRLSSPAGSLGMMAIPLVLAVVLGGAFGGDSGGVPHVAFVIEDHDDSWISSFYAGAFGREELADMFEVTVVKEGAREIVENNKASAALILPENFGSDLLNSRTVTLTLIKNPSQQISPVIAATAVDIMNLLLSQLRVVLAEPLDRIRDSLGTESDPSDMEIAAISVMISQEMRAIGRFAFPPAMELKVLEPEKTPEAETSGEPVNIYLFFFPGLIILGVFFVAEAYMSDLLEESRTGTLQRTLIAGISPARILAAKITGCILYCIASILLMRIIGWGFFSVGWGPVSAEALILLTTSLAMTGVMSMVFGMARNDRQGSIISTVVILIMSLLGGSMIPRRIMPGPIRMSGIWTPNYWSLEAWEAILIDHAVLTDVLAAAAVLTGMGLITAIAGWLLLSRKMNRMGAIR